MGVFTLLKEVQGAEKLVKFKQGKLMDAAHAQGAIDHALYAVTKDGACAAYAMAWLQEQYHPHQYAAPGQSRFERSKGVDSTAATLSRATAAEHAKYYADFLKSGSHKTLFHMYGLYPDTTTKAADPYTVLVRYSADLLPGTGAYLIFDCNESGTKSHAIALFKRSVDVVHFFDPNVGEYRITNASNTTTKGTVDRFFTQYLVLIVTQLKMHLGACTGSVMKLHQMSAGSDF